MGQRIDQINQARDLMDSLYRSIEMEIYRMYDIPTIPNYKGRMVIDREIVPDNVADHLLSHLKRIQREINLKIKYYGLQIYGVDLSKDGKVFKLHILCKSEPGRRSQEDRIEKTIYTHELNPNFVFDWKTKEIPVTHRFSTDEKRDLRQLRKLIRQRKI